MRRFLILIFALCAFLNPLISSGQSSSKEELKKIVAELNSEMPMSMGTMGVIESVSLDGDSLVYHVNVDFYENYTIGYNVPELQDVSDKFKLGFINLAQTNKEFGQALNYFSSNGIWFVGDIAIGDKSTKFAISPLEQKEILNSEPDYKLFIATNIAQTKDYLPMDMGVMKMTEYYLDGNDLVSTIEVDESQLSVAALKERRNTMKESIIDILKSGNEPTTAILMMNCAMAGYNVVYKYVGNISKDEVNITITPSEILSSINQ